VTADALDQVIQPAPRASHPSRHPAVMSGFAQEPAGVNLKTDWWSTAGDVATQVLPMKSGERGGFDRVLKSATCELIAF